MSPSKRWYLTKRVVVGQSGRGVYNPKDMAFKWTELSSERGKSMWSTHGSQGRPWDTKGEKWLQGMAAFHCFMILQAVTRIGQPLYRGCRVWEMNIRHASLNFSHNLHCSLTEWFTVCGQQSPQHILHLIKVDSVWLHQQHVPMACPSSEHKSSTFVCLDEDGMSAGASLTKTKSRGWFLQSKLSLRTSHKKILIRGAGS